MTLSHLFLLVAASTLLCVHAEDIVLGHLNCSSQWWQYQIQDMKAYILAFKDPNKRGASYVDSVIAGGKTDNPICKAKSQGTFSEIVVKPGDCGTMRTTLPDGTIQFQNFVVVNLRVPVGQNGAFITKRFHQTVSCKADPRQNISLPATFASAYILGPNLEQIFDISVGAQLEITYADFGHMIKVPIATLTFDFTNPADSNIYDIFIDNCNVSESKDPNALPRQQVIISPGIPNPEFTDLGLLEINQTRPPQIKVAGISFTDEDVNTLYYHCQINKCDKSSLGILCPKTSVSFRRRRSAGSSIPDTSLYLTPLDMTPEQPQRFLYKNGKIVLRKNSMQRLLGFST